MFSCLPVPASRRSAFEAGFSWESAEIHFGKGSSGLTFDFLIWVGLFSICCIPHVTYNSISLLFLNFSTSLHFIFKWLSSPWKEAEILSHSFTLEAQMKRKMLRAEEALGLVSYSPQSLLTSNSGSFQKAKKGNLCCTQPFCFLLLLWRPWKCP